MSEQGIVVALKTTFADFTLQAQFTAPARGITALFGDSGSGKTTCLRSIAGLESSAGFVSINGQVWQDDARALKLPVHQRALGFVFQDAGLFAHLSVRKNLEYGYRRIPAQDRGISPLETAKLFGIEHLLDRLPEHLSGGERQRVAIARALATNPRILLMDEPLAALDLSRKREILQYLERLHRELDIPVLYVTHAMDEVARLADHFILLESGRVTINAPLHQALTQLDSPVVQEEGACVVVEGTLAEHDQHDHLSRLDFSGGSLWVPLQAQPLGCVLRCQIRARDVSIALSRAHDSSILNAIAVTIVAHLSANTPAHTLLKLQCEGGSELLARITTRSYQQLNLTIGAKVWAQIKSVALLY